MADSKEAPCDNDVVTHVNRNATLEQLFGDLTGILLHRKIWQVYVVNKTRVTMVPYFTSSGLRALRRHPLNMRVVDASLEEITESILNMGYVAVMTSRPMLQETGEPGIYYVVGAASRIDGVYLAIERDPNNKFVQACSQQGLEDPIIIREDTPPCVVTHLVLDNNSFHKGAPNT